MHSLLAKFSHASLNASWFWGVVPGKGRVECPGMSTGAPLPSRGYSKLTLGPSLSLKPQKICDRSLI